MVKIALDPAMYHADLSVADEVRKAAELGYEYLELSPRADFFFWHRYPKADAAEIADVKKACKETGVKIQDSGPGVQLVVRGRTGATGPGAELAPVAGDRRRTGMPDRQFRAVREPERSGPLRARVLPIDVRARPRSSRSTASD